MGCGMSVEQQQEQDAQLQPFSPPLGIHQRYCAQELTTLVLREKAFTWSGDDFSVRTVDGRLVLRCDAKVFSMRDRKEYLDEFGQFLFAVKKEIFSIPATFNAEDANGQRMFTLEGKWSFPSAKTSCLFNNMATNQVIELKVQGDWVNRSANITIQGRPVAFVRRSFLNKASVLADMHTYYVSVAPGVDLTLIAAVCIAMDDRESDR